MGTHKFIRDTGISNTNKNRFYSNIIINGENDCLEWRGTMKSNGYGQFRTLNKKWFHAHRYSYELFVSEIPVGMCVLHKCDNRKCVNPEHLWVGTKKENTQDMFLKQRNGYCGLKGEKNGKAKLNCEDVALIRKIYSKEMNCTKLSKIYSVSISAIDRIVRNVTWNHIKGDK